MAKKQELLDRIAQTPGEPVPRRPDPGVPRSPADVVQTRVNRKIVRRRRRNEPEPVPEPVAAEAAPETEEVAVEADAPPPDPTAEEPMPELPAPDPTAEEPMPDPTEEAPAADAESASESDGDSDAASESGADAGNDGGKGYPWPATQTLPAFKSLHSKSLCWSSESCGLNSHT